MKTKLCEVRYKLTGAHALYKKDEPTALAYVGTEAVRMEVYTFHDVELEAVFLVSQETEHDDTLYVVSAHKSYETAEAWIQKLRQEDWSIDRPHWTIQIEELKP